jgi:hypothetical protein
MNTNVALIVAKSLGLVLGCSILGVAITYVSNLLVQWVL